MNLVISKYRFSLPGPRSESSRIHSFGCFYSNISFIWCTQIFSNDAHPKTDWPKVVSRGLVFYLSLFMMMDLSDIITKEDSLLAWASMLAATALHGWFFSGEKPIVTRVLWADLLLFQKGKIVA